MTAHQDRRTDGLTLTPDAGLAVQPSSAVAVLVSIKVSEGQKEKNGASEELLDSEVT